MKKKHSAKSTPGPLATIRAATAYRGARAWLGIPFILASLGLLTGCVGALLTLRFFEAAGLFVGAMFCLSLSTLGHAIFDLADCALISASRDKARDAREAMENYRARQEL